MSCLDSIPQVPDTLSQYLDQPAAKVPELIEFKKQLSLFSEAIKTLCNTSYSAQAKHMARVITKHQQKLIDSLSDEKTILSQRLINRLTKHVKKCQTFQELFKSRGQLKSSAELIFPHLNDQNFRKAIRRDCLTQKASDYFKNNASRSLTCAREFMQRVHEEKYGLKLKARLLDTSENIVFAQESFLRLLYLDLIMQDKDPAEHTEWFQTQPGNIFQSAKKALAQLRENNSEENDGRLLLCNEALPKEINAQISSVTAKANLPASLYNLVLDYLRLYFSPTSSELNRALSLILDKDPSEGLVLAKAMLSEQDLSHVQEIMKTIKNKSPDQAKELIQSLKNEKSLLYPSVLSQWLILSLEAPDEVGIEAFLQQLRPIAETKESEEALLALIRAKTTPSLPEDDKERLIETIFIKESIASLDLFIKKMLPDDLEANEFAEKMKSLRELLDKRANSKIFFEIGLAFLSLRLIEKAKEPTISDQFVALYDEITQRKIRHLLLDRLCFTFTSKYKPAEVVSAIKTFANKLKHQKESSYLIKLACFGLAYINKEAAKELAALIPDALTKAHVSELIQLISPNRKPTIEIHTIGFGQGESQQLLRTLMNQLGQPIS